MLKTKKTLINTHKAFSLAELLVAMTIVALIVMTLTPTFIKKRAKAQKPGGFWECKLNENGAHVSVTTKENGGTTTKFEGEYCVFEPKPYIEEYLVTVLGGGGGGASGNSLAYDAVSYGEAVGFRLDQAGKYDLILIGGGGSGSASKGKLNEGGYGGSAGDVYVKYDVNLPVDYYVLKAGRGGVAGGLPKPSDEDESSETQNEYCKPKTNNQSQDTSWDAVCNGEDGFESRIYSIKKNKDGWKARGGYAGGKKYDSKVKAGQAYKDKDKCASRASNGQLGGKLQPINNSDCKKALESIRSELSYLGSGGNGSYSEVAYPGYNGLAMIRSGIFYSGGGGKPGGIAFASIKDIRNPVKVYIGKGGLGATYEAADGSAGENSSFGFYLSAKGGNGGRVKALSSTDETQRLEGEPGGKSPFAGETYGEGGAGGWAYSVKNTNVTERWGEGEDGKSGYVRVEWN